MYDAVIIFLRVLINVFFKLKSRGTHFIPSNKEACIFVVAPHANQFVDPLMLLTTCKRRVGFLIALKSFNKFWLNPFARALHCIPVQRPQDSMVPGSGTIYLSSLTEIKGCNSNILFEIEHS